MTDFTISTLSHIISHGKHYYMVLENDQTKSVMEFEHNTNLTLRSLIKDEAMFLKLVEKIVEINRREGGAG